MISADDIDAFEARFEQDDDVVKAVLDRVRAGATVHRRIMADEEAPILRMLHHYRERCFELATDQYRAGLVSMDLGEPKKATADTMRT